MELIKMLLLFVSFCNIQANEQGYPTFEEYVVQFDKKYENEEEYNRRKEIYDERIESFTSIEDFVPNVNQMTDWTDQQRKKWKTLNTIVPNFQLKSKNHDIISRVGKPTSLDWRQKGAVTSIKNQGSCGSCWAFTAAAYAESRLIIKGQANSSINLSEQYLLSCTEHSDCNGGFLEYAFEQMTNGGLPTENQYPYQPYERTSSFICSTGSKVTIGYIPKSIYDATDSQLEDLLQEGPVAIAVSSGRWEDYGRGIFSCRSKDSIDHAALLVGYTPDYWIIKNEWGNKWGENGYIRVKKSRYMDENCKIGTSAFVLYEKIGEWCIFMIILIVIG